MKRKLSPDSIRVENLIPKFIKDNIRRLILWNGIHYRAVETKEFVYFVNYRESDEMNGIIMFRRENDLLELKSANFLAANDLFELLHDGLAEITYLSPSMKVNLTLMMKEELSQ